MQRNASYLKMPSEASQEGSIQTLRQRFYLWRNKKIGDPDFQRWARRNPIARFVARRRARELFDLCAGFVYSQVLSSCVELGVFDLLESGPKHRDDIAKACDLDSSACDTLMRSAVSLKLLQLYDENQYCLGIHGAALLANPGIQSMIEHHTFLYRDLKDPVSIMRRDQPQTLLSAFWDYQVQDKLQSSKSEKQPYTQLMSASQGMIAEQIVDCYPMKNHQQLLDVGGGDGTFLRKMIDAAPDLKLMLLDLPAVADQAKRHFEASQIACECIGGNMLTDALPVGADIISLVRVVHDHNDEEALALLRNCHDALPTGGTILLAEPMAVERVGDPTTDAYFGFYLHAMGRGRPRTATELTALLAKAGFIGAKQIPTQLPMLVRMISARSSKAN